jgi:hypothetical protein
MAKSNDPAADVHFIKDISKQEWSIGQAGSLENEQTL